MANLLDPDPAGVACSIASDVVKAGTLVESHEGLDKCTSHRLLQEAHAHLQQICPELSPNAMSVRTYEKEPLRISAEAFVRNTAMRKAIDQPTIAFEPVVSSGGTLTARLRAEGSFAAVILAFKVEVHSHSVVDSIAIQDPTITQSVALHDDTSEVNSVVAPLLRDEYPVPPGEALHGIIVQIGGLPQGVPLQIVVAATSGCEWCPWTSPYNFTMPEEMPPSGFSGSDEMVQISHSDERVEDATQPLESRDVVASSKDPLSPTVLEAKSTALPSAKSRRSFRGTAPKVVARQQSRRRSAERTPLVLGPMIRVVGAELRGGDAVSLSWLVEGGGASTKRRWAITFTPNADLEPCRYEATDTHVALGGLLPGMRYVFRIEAAQSATVPLAHGELCVRGSSVAPLPRAAEGVVLTPPQSDNGLDLLKNDPAMTQISHGIFVPSSHSAS